MTYAKVLVGTDGSATARVAEHAAALLARAENAELVLVSAYGDAAAETTSILERSVADATEVWPRTRSRAARGRPAEVLVSLARDEGADLLVLGNKGMTGTAGFLLGSVPDRVSHNAPCDLLIVKTAGARPDGERLVYRRVLIATDGSQTSLQAVRRGFSLCSTVGATPVLFYAGHPKTAEIVFTEVAREFLPAAMLQTASAAGDPADAITSVARDEAYDLVVIGNKGMPGGRLRRTVPNRVSHQVATDLLIVKTVSTSVDELVRGDGAIVTIGGEKVAAYRDDSGEVHMLSARCTHLGCTVGWNADARTWDCPCHGSRFDAIGNVIRGPAHEALSPFEEVS